MLIASILKIVTGVSAKWDPFLHAMLLHNQIVLKTVLVNSGQ